MHFTERDVAELLSEWPRLRRRPSPAAGRAVVAGIIRFEAMPAGKPAVTDEEKIRIESSLVASSSLPQAYEEGGRIERHIDNHVYSDGGMCLGSPLRLLQVLGASPTLNDFVSKCVVPFLYAASWRKQGHPDYPFDELPHGGNGLVEDYQRLFDLSGADSVARTLGLLTLRRRVANKKMCPCGCNRKLAACPLRGRLAPFRRLAARNFYEEQRQLVTAEAAQVAKREVVGAAVAGRVRIDRRAPLLAVSPRAQSRRWRLV